MRYVPSIIEFNGTVELNYDLYSRLLKDRIVFIDDQIDEDSSSSVIGQLMFLDSQNNDEITMVITSPGGSVYHGLSIIDTMNMIKSPVKVVCMGMAASMGAMILSAGAKGRRFASKSARIMIHSVSSWAQGTYHDMKIDIAETEYLQKYLINMLSENTGKSKQKIAKDMERDKWFSAEEAKVYGLIDESI